MEEGADQVGAGAEAAHRLSEAGLEGAQVGWAEAGEGVLLEPSPEPLVGIEFRSVGGQPVEGQPTPVTLQGATRLEGAMRIQPIPEQEQGPGDAA